MNDLVKKVNVNDLRLNLSKYLKENLGETIYITRYNKLFAELKVYNDAIRIKTELKIAEKMLKGAYKNKF